MGIGIVVSFFGILGCPSEEAVDLAGRRVFCCHVTKWAIGFSDPEAAAISPREVVPGGFS